MVCLNRITRNEFKLPFSDKKHYFYTESACGNASDGDLCTRCSKKVLEHGLVSGPYMPKSHIFDSPWYHKSIKAYGIPDKINLEKAYMEQKKARKVTKKDTTIISDKPIILPLDKMVESMDEPIQVESVVRLSLRIINYKDTVYWLDEEDKIYKRLSSGKLEEMGQWDGTRIHEN